MDYLPFRIDMEVTPSPWVLDSRRLIDALKKMG